MSTEAGRAERALALVLRITGCVMLLALLAVPLPRFWIAVVHEVLRIGDMPLDAPIIPYLARSASLLYACVGAIFVLLSFDVRRYVPLLRLLGWGTPLGGVTMLLIDLTAPMPGYWTAAEGPFIISLGLAIALLVRRVPAAPVTPPLAGPPG